MATKTISITEEAYERLAARKKEKESFSDVINKLTTKRSLLDFAGLLSETEARDLEKNILDGRKQSRKRADSMSL